MEQLKRFDELRALSLQAADEELGRIRDIYFDCETWRVRYIAVNEGILQRHRVHLIPAVALGDIDERNREFLVQLTRDEVLRSPAMDDRSILDRQVERAVYDYYGWPVYWEYERGPEKGSAHSEVPLVAPAAYDEGHGPGERRVLCRLSQLEGCMLRSDGNTLGVVDDVLIDTRRWRVVYLQVEPGRDEAQQRYVNARNIRYVDWADRQIVTSDTDNNLSER